MTQILAGIDLNALQWATLIFAAFLVGFSKTGIGGVMMLAIPLLATMFGGKDSTGIILPMLITGDIFAILYYHRSAKWSNIIKPLPWALIGLAAGAVAGNYLNDGAFVILIGIIVLACLVILVFTEIRGQDMKVPDAPWFYILVGILSGFASMMGNAAGPIFSVYLLSLGIQKNNFMGITAWFFFIINMTKVPLQIFVWHNMGVKTLTLAVLMIPVITIGAVSGAFILKKINEKFFRYLVIVMTALAAFKLFL